MICFILPYYQTHIAQNYQIKPIVLGPQLRGK